MIARGGRCFLIFSWGLNRSVLTGSMETRGKGANGVLEIIVERYREYSHMIHQQKWGITELVLFLGMTEVHSCVQSKCLGSLPGCTKPCRTCRGNKEMCPFPPDVIMCNPSNPVQTPHTFRLDARMHFSTQYRLCPLRHEITGFGRLDPAAGMTQAHRRSRGRGRRGRAQAREGRAWLPTAMKNRGALMRRATSTMQPA